MAEMVDSTASADTVNDEEVLYRRVENDRFFFEYNNESGELLVTHQAFRDRYLRPSVDRAKLCNHDPRWTQWDHEEAGVVSLVAGDVRVIAPPITTNDSRGRLVTQHTIDVLPDPITEIKMPGDRINLAHAQIISSPLAKGGAFDRLLVALASIARKRGWLIRPLHYRE